MDWSEDWSESSPCAEDVFPEQSQALALISDDVSSPECVQQAKVLVAEANRKLAQARSAVASAKQNRSGFFPPSNVSSSRKGKGKGKVKSKSKDSSCLICGRSFERRSKGSGKGGKNGSRTFYLGASWGFDSELFETVVLQADVVLDCGATETAGGVEAVQILVDAVTQGFSDSRVEVDSRQTMVSFRQWSLAQGSLKSLAADSYGMDQHLHFRSRKRASSCRYEFA